MVADYEEFAFHAFIFQKMLLYCFVQAIMRWSVSELYLIGVDSSKSANIKRQTYNILTAQEDFIFEEQLFMFCTGRVVQRTIKLTSISMIFSFLTFQ